MEPHEEEEARRLAPPPARARFLRASRTTLAYQAKHRGIRLKEYVRVGLQARLKERRTTGLNKWTLDKPPPHCPSGQEVGSGTVASWNGVVGGARGSGLVVRRMMEQELQRPLLVMGARSMDRTTTVTLS